MKLSDDDIKEYQVMWKTRFKEDISKEAAYDAAIALIEFVGVVYQPLAEKDLLMVEKSRKQMYGDKEKC